MSGRRLIVTAMPNPVRLAALLAASAVTVAACGSSGTSPGRHPTAPAAARSAKPAPVLTASRIARAIARAEPAGRVVVLNAPDDPDHLLGRPGGYSSKAVFADKRIRHKGPDLAGCAVEVYPARSEAMARGRYLTRLSLAVPMTGTEYDYVAGTAVLRISGMLTPAQARSYGLAFEKATGLQAVSFTPAR